MCCINPHYYYSSYNVHSDDNIVNIPVTNFINVVFIVYRPRAIKVTDEPGYLMLELEIRIPGSKDICHFDRPDQSFEPGTICTIARHILCMHIAKQPFVFSKQVAKHIRMALFKIGSLACVSILFEHHVALLVIC